MVGWAQLSDTSFCLVSTIVDNVSLPFDLLVSWLTSPSTTFCSPNVLKVFKIVY